MRLQEMARKYKVDWEIDVPSMVQDLGADRAKELRRESKERARRQRGLRESFRNQRGDKGSVILEVGGPPSSDLLPPDEIAPYFKYTVEQGIDDEEAERIVDERIEAFRSSPEFEAFRRGSREGGG